MAGKFLDKTYVGTINAIQQGQKERLDNSFYTFTDKTPTTVTYFNINTAESTLDEATKMTYSYTDADASLRYNRINDCILFDIDRITVNLEAGEYGVESDTIEGECYLIPNAFKPYPQDYFIINHMDEEALFKITNVSTDTMPNGANMYKLSYRLSSNDIDNSDLANLVVESYTMNTTNIGTNLSMVIKDDDLALIQRLEDIMTDMIIYYRGLFYSSKVQTYIYTYDDRNFYDPYMIEFMIRNNIMNSRTVNYQHVAHQLHLPSTFYMDYQKTFFNSLEDKKINLIYNPPIKGLLIEDPTSIMNYCIEDYYQCIHRYIPGAYLPVKAFDDDTVERIISKRILETTDPYYFKNIITLYFNGMGIDEFTLNSLESFNYSLPANEIFYYIPVIIYILQRKIESIMRNISRK